MSHGRSSLIFLILCSMAGCASSGSEIPDGSDEISYSVLDDDRDDNLEPPKGVALFEDCGQVEEASFMVVLSCEERFIRVTTVPAEITFDYLKEVFADARDPGNPLEWEEVQVEIAGQVSTALSYSGAPPGDFDGMKEYGIIIEDEQGSQKRFIECVEMAEIGTFKIETCLDYIRVVQASNLDDLGRQSPASGTEFFGRPIMPSDYCESLGPTDIRCGQDRMSWFVDQTDTQLKRLYNEFLDSLQLQILQEGGELRSDRVFDCTILESTVDCREAVIHYPLKDNLQYLVSYDVFAPVGDQYLYLTCSTWMNSPPDEEDPLPELCAEVMHVP